MDPWLRRQRPRKGAQGSQNNGRDVVGQTCASLPVFLGVFKLLAHTCRPPRKMLAAALTIASAILAAFSVLVAAAFPRLHAFELLFISPSLGLSVSAWIAFALKSLPGAGHGFSPSVVWGTIGVQVAIGLFAARWSIPALTTNVGRVRAELRTHRASLYFLAALSAWWFYMSHIHYLFRRGSDHIAGGSVYADLPFHLNIASSFLSGANEAKGITDTLTSTFYAGAPLAYPFIPGTMDEGARQWISLRLVHLHCPALPSRLLPRRALRGRHGLARLADCDGRPAPLVAHCAGLRAQRPHPRLHARRVACARPRHLHGGPRRLLLHLVQAGLVDAREPDLAGEAAAGWR